jgi:hypothetical protein
MYDGGARALPKTRVSLEEESTFEIKLSGAVQSRNAAHRHQRSLQNRGLREGTARNSSAIDAISPARRSTGARGGTGWAHILRPHNAGTFESDVSEPFASGTRGRGVAGSVAPPPSAGAWEAAGLVTLAPEGMVERPCTPRPVGPLESPLRRRRPRRARRATWCSNCNVWKSFAGTWRHARCTDGSRDRQALSSWGCPVARITVRSTHGRYCVTVSGQLRGRDLRRLEHACGPALERRDPPLTVTLASPDSVDEPARAYLERLITRGAVVQFE